MHVKLPSIMPPDSLRMHLQPSIFKKFLGACPRIPLEGLRACGTRQFTWILTKLHTNMGPYTRTKVTYRYS